MHQSMQRATLRKVFMPRQWKPEDESLSIRMTAIGGSGSGKTHLLFYVLFMLHSTKSSTKPNVRHRFHSAKVFNSEEEGNMQYGGDGRYISSDAQDKEYAELCARVKAQQLAADQPLERPERPPYSIGLVPYGFVETAFDMRVVEEYVTSIKKIRKDELEANGYSSHNGLIIMDDVLDAKNTAQTAFKNLLKAMRHNWISFVGAQHRITDTHKSSRTNLTHILVPPSVNNTDLDTIRKEFFGHMKKAEFDDIFRRCTRDAHSSFRFMVIRLNQRGTGTNEDVFQTILAPPRFKRPHIFNIKYWGVARDRLVKPPPGSEGVSKSREACRYLHRQR